MLNKILFKILLFILGNQCVLADQFQNSIEMITHIMTQNLMENKLEIMQRLYSRNSLQFVKSNELLHIQML